MAVAKQPVSKFSSETKSLQLPFAKLQGLGNDFVFLAEEDLEKSDAGQNLLDNWLSEKSAIARALCDRRLGIGADGLILVKRARHAKCLLSWSYTNSDGSPSAMCGNGIRCLGLWAHRRGLIETGEFLVETEIGLVPVEFRSEDVIKTDLGEPILASELIPVSGAARENVLHEPIAVANGESTIHATCVSMGNPHCVTFDHEFNEDKLSALASQIQMHPMFPEGVNVEFVQIDSPTRARVIVWERGAGRTLACATGAAAVLVAGVLEGRLQRDATIVLPGGELRIEWSEKDNRVRITGPAKFVFEGNVDLRPLLSKLSS